MEKADGARPLGDFGDHLERLRIKLHTQTGPPIGPELAAAEIEVPRQVRDRARTGAGHLHQNGTWKGGLSLDIPQCEIESAQGVQLLTPRGIKVTPVHQLPEVLDPAGIFADEHRRALDDRVARSTLADSGDALI